MVINYRHCIILYFVDSFLDFCYVCMSVFGIFNDTICANCPLQTDIILSNIFVTV